MYSEPTEPKTLSFVNVVGHMLVLSDPLRALRVDKRALAYSFEREKSQMKLLE